MKSLVAITFGGEEGFSETKSEYCNNLHEMINFLSNFKNEEKVSMIEILPITPKGFDLIHSQTIKIGA